MTITPNEARELTQTEIALADRLEELTDAVLREKFTGGVEKVIVPITIPINLRTRQEFEKRYENAGWSTQYRNDQRDGEWYELWTKEGSILDR